MKMHAELRVVGLPKRVIFELKMGPVSHTLRLNGRLNYGRDVILVYS